MNLNAIDIESVPLKTILTPNVVTVSPETKLQEVLALMKMKSISSIVAVDKADRPVGIFTEQDAIKLMVRYKSLSGLLMQDVMSHPVLTAEPHLGYGQAYQLMAEHRVRHLVVIDQQGKLVGLVSEGDFLHHMGMEYLVELKTVGSAMTRSVKVIEHSHYLTEALKLMSNQRISCLVVLKDGLPIGMLTERDMVKIASENDDVRHLKVQEQMSFPLISVNADMPLQVASRLMQERGIRRVTVVNSDGRLEGLLTRHDIAKALQGSYIEYLQETLERKSRDLLSVESRLREVEQRDFYHNMVEQVSDAIYVVDADDGRILDANGQAARSLGISLDELLNLRVNDFSTRIEDVDYWTGQVLPRLRDNGEISISTEHRKADGSSFPVEVKARLVTFRQKEYVVAIARDVTERIEANRRLLESEKRFQSLFENAPMAYQSLNMEGQIQAVNKAWLDMMQMQREEVLGRKITEFLSEMSAKKLTKTFPDFQEQKKISGPLFELIRKDGSVRLAQVEGQISLDEESGEYRTHCILIDVTETHQAEQNLRESEQRFRGLFEKSPVSMAYVHFNGDLISLNEQFSAVFGYTAEDLPNIQQWFEQVHPDPEYRELVSHHWLKKVSEAREGNHHISAYEYSVVCKQGEEKLVRASGVTTEQGFLAILEDVTGQRKASEALKESAETYFGVITTSLDGFWVVDMEGNLLDVNEAYVNMSGYSREELMDLDINDLDVLETPEDTADRMRRIVEQGSMTFLTKHRRKNGSHFDVEIRTSHWSGSGGRFFVFLRDVTERKQNEDQLRQAAAVFDNTTEGVMITDPEGQIQRVNAAFCRLTGYSENEVVGQNSKVLQSGRHDQAFYAEMWRSISEKGWWQGEIWNRRKDGSTYPELLSVSSVKDEEGGVTHYVGVFADISQLKESEQKLAYLAHHDMLTGLPNRLMLQSRLAQSLALAKRNNTRLALLLLDLDRFKNVNDSFGHAAGDELLQQVSTLLRERVRQVDMVCRMGGDEFALLLEDIHHIEDAGVVANEIINLLAKSWSLSNGCDVVIGASVGISIFPSQSQDAEELLQHADAALYRAKGEGRGRFHYFTDELTREARNRLELEARLIHGLARDEFVVYYQPQIDISTEELVGAEALVRWNDPERGLIPPVHFIPLAEQTGFINEIGLFVLKQACLQLKAWIDMGYKPISLGVNLSAVQLRHSDLLHTITTVLENSGLPAKYLELEITESALMEREQESIALLKRLRELGVRVAIDDFGTGYSSLSYLKKFPLDVLKIDKSFVDDIPHDKDDMVIASTIVAMGHSLGLKVLAEGVETPEQLEFLNSKNCHYYQGYLTSPPVPADQFERFLHK